jgi:hypothetical protein
MICSVPCQFHARIAPAQTNHASTHPQQGKKQILEPSFLLPFKLVQRLLKKAKESRISKSQSL